MEEGNSQAVQALVASAAGVSQAKKNKIINYARRWTEVDYRMSGFTQEYEWFDLTPVATAASKGHHDIVQYLLEQGADPTLEGCPDENIHVSALEAANQELSRAIGSGNMANCNRPRRCVDLLEVATLFWNRASYAGSHYNRAGRLEFTNSPTNIDDLHRALNEVSDIGFYPERSLNKEDLRNMKERYHL